MVVRALLARGDVNLNQPDNDGKTPFYVASINGREGVVKLLLSRGTTNPQNMTMIVQYHSRALLATDMSRYSW